MLSTVAFNDQHLRTLRLLDDLFLDPVLDFPGSLRFGYIKKNNLYDLMTPYHLVFGRKRCTYFLYLVSIDVLVLVFALILLVCILFQDTPFALVCFISS